MNVSPVMPLVPWKTRIERIGLLWCPKASVVKAATERHAIGLFRIEPRNGITATSGPPIEKKRLDFWRRRSWRFVLIAVLIAMSATGSNRSIMT